jgi:Na+/melibiose symporter-like transporter
MTQGGPALPFSTKLFYGFGSIAYGIKDNAFAYFLLFVYVQIFGLAPELAGLAILVMLIFDAVSDPLIGYISDNTRSRWGRRHPFMYGSIIPVALTFFLIWDPPRGRLRSDPVLVFITHGHWDSHNDYAVRDSQYGSRT